MTDDGTNIAANSVTNGSRIYLFTGVRPGTYTIRVEASGLASQERKALNLAVSQRATLYFSYHQAAVKGLSGPDSASVFNAACFEKPADQVAGDAPRYFSNLRTDGIHNSDLSLSKEISIREGMKLQIRGEFFNFTNTPRFGLPGIFFGDPDFGLVTSTLNNPRRTQIGVRFQF